METIFLTEKNKEYKVEITYSEYSDNPFKEWDFICPILTFEHKDIFNYSEVMEFIMSKLDDKTIKRNLKNIKLIYDDFSFDKQEIDYCGSIIDYIEYVINDTEKIEKLHEICLLIGIHSKVIYSAGYSQGDYIEGLIVITDEFLKKTGYILTLDNEEIFNYTKDVFNACIWNDIFTATIYKKETYSKKYDSSDEVIQGCDYIEIDSCNNFFGTNHEKSGLMDYVRETINNIE